MALRLNTVEYCLSQKVDTSLGIGGSCLFPVQNIYIPETSGRTFVSAFVDLAIQDSGIAATTPTSASCGIRLGTNAITKFGINDTMTNSGENQSFHFIFDVSSIFTNQFPITSTLQTVDVSCAMSVVTSTANHTAKLVITYTYDDTDPSNNIRIKTVRIPIESSTGGLGSTLAALGNVTIPQVPALDYFLPEASKAYRDIWFESWCNTSTQAATAPNPYMTWELDNDTSVLVTSGNDLPHEDTLVSAVLYRRIWKRAWNVDISTNIEHTFKAAITSTANMPFRHMGVVMYVTYEYYEPDTTRVLNSLMMAGADEFGAPGAATSTEITRFTRKLIIPDNNPILKHSAVQFSYIDANDVSMYVRVGYQPAFTAYTNGVNNVVCGGYTFIHRFDASSRGGQGVTLTKDGSLYVDWYTQYVTPQGVTGTNVSALLYLNYEADKSSLPGGSANNPKTILTLGKQYTSSSFTTKWYAKPIPIPEPRYWLMGLCPVITTIKWGTTQTPDFITFDAQKDASTSSGGGWENLYAGYMNLDSETAWTMNYSRARDSFRRWPLDTDTDRMDISQRRQFRFQRNLAVNAFNNYWITSYHTITNYISGVITGYAGTGVGIPVRVYDNIWDMMIIDTSTATGGQWGFYWYNSSTNFIVEAYEDATHHGGTEGKYDTSLNIAFGGSGGTPTSWVF